MVLAQKQTLSSMEQDTKLRNKPTHLCSINLQKKEARIYNEEKALSITSDTGKTGQLHVKE